MEKRINKENFDISIIGRQTYEENSDVIEVNTSGSYTKKGDTRYIRYKEYGIDGADEEMTNTIKVEDGKVTLIRQNSATRLIMEPGKRHLCLYETGFGNLTVGIFTDFIKSTLKDSGGRLDIRYTIDVDSNLSSVNVLTAKVRRKKPDLIKDIEA